MIAKLTAQNESSVIIGQVIESAEHRHQQVVRNLVQTNQQRVGEATIDTEDKHREIIRQVRQQEHEKQLLLINVAEERFEERRSESQRQIETMQRQMTQFLQEKADNEIFFRKDRARMELYMQQMEQRDKDLQHQLSISSQSGKLHKVDSPMWMKR